MRAAMWLVMPALLVGCELPKPASDVEKYGSDSDARAAARKIVGGFLNQPRDDDFEHVIATLMPAAGDDEKKDKPRNWIVFGKVKAGDAAGAPQTHSFHVTLNKSKGEMVPLVVLIDEKRVYADPTAIERGLVSSEVSSAPPPAVTKPAPATTATTAAGATPSTTVTAAASVPPPSATAAVAATATLPAPSSAPSASTPSFIVDPRAGKPLYQLRDWTFTDGKKIRGRLASFGAGKIRITDEAGATHTFDSAKLSEADVKFVENQGRPTP